MIKKQIIIVAGGKGLRMGTDIPKQFLPINGKPILMYTIETFFRFDNQIGIILVLPKEQHIYWNELCKEHHFTIVHQIAEGGETRFHSVKNGLSLAANDGIIGIHDGVRPFVAQEVIARCYDAASHYEAVVPVIDIIETVRQIDAQNSVTVDRDAYKLVQTPQVFTALLIKEAYEQDYTPHFTDDASVVEAMGKSITLVQGNRENIKITTPFDIQIANALTNV